MSRPFEAILQAALAYTRAGYSVFPVDPESKRPLTGHGFKDATQDEATIGKMFSRWPVGIAIAAEGLVVIDVDETDAPWLSDHEVEQALALGPMSRTPSGGRHHFFRRPHAFRGKCWNGQVAAGIDIKTDGGYVVVPPTSRAEGGYEWRRGDLRDTPRDHLPLLPGALNRHIEQTAARLACGNHGTGPRVKGRIPEGRRNSTLTSHAGLLRRRGLGQTEIAADLHAMNAERCDPPLSHAEVDRIAASILRYPEGRSAGSSRNPPPLLVPLLTFDAVMATSDDGREVLIDGIMKRGDIVNLIGVPKSRKSILVTQIAMEMASGKNCLGAFPTKRGRTLIIDAEVGAASLRDRFKVLADALGIDRDDLSRSIDVYDLRGVWDQAGQCEAILASLQAGEYDLVIVDPLYRMLPDGADENDNIQMATFYRMLGHHTTRCAAGCFVVHHAPKSNGFNRATTDAGAGAGAISRAADGQLVLAHQEGGWILKGVFRAFPDFNDRRLSRGELAWSVDGAVEPQAKQGVAAGKQRKQPLSTPGEFATRFVTVKPEPACTIIARAEAEDISARRARTLLDAAVSEGLVLRSSKGGRAKDLFSLQVAGDTR